jgi:spore coat polysaccharide biosynthesis predicted glycosyltransferase SpsG
MNRDPILFRVDGTTQGGWERLCRCMTYAAALQRRRRPTYFLSQLDPAHLALAIKRAGNNWLEADSPVGEEEDLTETIQEIRRIQPAAVVVDSANVSEAYLKELMGTGVLLVSFDSQAAIRFPSHLVINPLLGPSRESYEFLPGTQLLLGTRYSLVRPEIRRVRPIRSMEPAQPSPTGYRVAIALGDDDPNGQVLELTQTLLNIAKLEKIDLLVRSQHPELAKMQELAETMPQRLSVATEPNEVTARLTRCHFAIGSGSSWSIELACVGIPQLLIVQNEMHWPTAQRLEEEGAAQCLGWHETTTANTIRQAIQNLLSDPLERQAMMRCGRQLIDARGPDRLVTALEVLLHPSRFAEVDFLEAA